MSVQDVRLTNCRLCNYQSDERLMLNIFVNNTDYADKITKFLYFKVFLDYCD